MKKLVQLSMVVTLLFLSNVLLMAAGPYPNTGNQSVCINSTESYGVISTLGSTYAWTVDDAATSPSSDWTITGNGASSVSVTWSKAGAYSLKVIEKNSNGCYGDPVTMQVTVYATPTTATVGSTQNICGSLTSTSLGGNTPTDGTGAWDIVSGGTGSFSAGTSGSSTFTADAYGTYLLRWTISNGPCTVSTASVTVNYYATPTTATVGSTQNICGSLTSTSLGGNTPTNGAGAWDIVSGGTGSFSAGTSGSSTFTADAYGTYVLRWTISNGTCTVSTASVTVNYYATPTTATVGSTQNICGSLTSTSLGGNTPTNGAGAWDIVSGGTGSFSAGTSGSSTFTADAYGTYVLRWTISNGTCTVSTASVTVNYYATPTTASVGSTQNICGSLTSASLGGNTPTVGAGAWDIVSGGTGSFSAGTTGSSTFTADAYGTYELRWTISNGTCTVSTASVNVNFYATPTTASVGSTQDICGSLTSASLGGNTPTNGAGAWDIVSGGTGSFSAGTSGSSTFTADAYGTYVLRWTISNGTCTVSTASVTVNYYATPTTATVGSTQNICGSLTSTSLGGNTPTNGAGAWDIVSGGTGSFSAGTSGSSTFTADAYGTYVLRWTISNGTCTASTATVTVNYYATPTTATVGATQNICGTLTSGALGGNIPSNGTGAWDIVSGGTGSFSAGGSGSSTFTADAYGTYVLRWTISNGTCTASTATVTVNYYETPQVSDMTSNACSGDPIGVNLPTTSTNSLTIVKWNISCTPPAGITGIATTGDQTDLSAITGDTFTNTTTNSIDVTYTVIPYTSTCAGTPFTIKVTIYAPVITSPIYHN